MGKLRSSKGLYIFLCYLGSIVIGMQSAGYQAILFDIAAEFSMSATGQGTLAAIQYISGIIVPLVFGGLADRFRKRAVICVFAAVYAAVSYTHLDVYKRQMQAWPCWAPCSLWWGCS